MHIENVRKVQISLITLNQQLLELDLVSNNDLGLRKQICPLDEKSNPLRLEPVRKFLEQPIELCRTLDKHQVDVID